MIFQFLKNDKIFFFSMEFHVNWLLKVLVLNVSDIGKMVFFEPRSWWKDDIYWLLKSFCFELFGDPKEGLFLEPKVLGKRIFTDCWKVLVFEPKSWWEHDIYLVFLSFPWHSRTWEIRFFVQCLSLYIAKKN